MKWKSDWREKNLTEEEIRDDGLPGAIDVWARDDTSKNPHICGGGWCTQIKIREMDCSDCPINAALRKLHYLEQKYGE